jgi:hypothetical protein
MTVASMDYRAIGWGSHHWEVASMAGARWFVTADEPEYKGRSESEPLAAGFERPRALAAPVPHDRFEWPTGSSFG